MHISEIISYLESEDFDLISRDFQPTDVYGDKYQEIITYKRYFPSPQLRKPINGAVEVVIRCRMDKKCNCSGYVDVSLYRVVAGKENWKCSYTCMDIKEWKRDFRGINAVWRRTEK